MRPCSPSRERRRALPEHVHRSVAPERLSGLCRTIGFCLSRIFEDGRLHRLGTIERLVVCLVRVGDGAIASDVEWRVRLNVAADGYPDRGTGSDVFAQCIR